MASPARESFSREETTAGRVAELVARIERVAKEFEEVHKALGGKGGSPAKKHAGHTHPEGAGAETAGFAGLATKLSDIADQADATQSSLAAPVKAEEEDAVCIGVRKFHEMMHSQLVPFLEAAGKLGGDVTEQAICVGQAFSIIRDIVTFVEEQRCPADDAQLAKLIAPIDEMVGKIDAFREAGQAGDKAAHLAMIAGGAACLSWVRVPKEPALLVSDALNSLPTYGARIARLGPDHEALVDTFKSLMRVLYDVVRNSFPSGLTSYPCMAEKAGTGAAAGGPALSAGDRSSESKAAAESAIKAYDALIDGPLEDWIKEAVALGDEMLTEQSEAVRAAFEEQREMISAAARCKPPTQAQLQELIEPTSLALQDVEEARETDRTAEFYNHTSLVAGGMGLLGWITIKINPTVMMVDVVNSTSIYGDKIAKTGEDGQDPPFLTTFRTVLQALLNYVKDHHPKGLDWNVDGDDVADYLAELELED